MTSTEALAGLSLILPVDPEVDVASVAVESPAGAVSHVEVGTLNSFAGVLGQLEGRVACTADVETLAQLRPLPIDRLRLIDTAVERRAEACATFGSLVLQDEGSPIDVDGRDARCIALSSRHLRASNASVVATVLGSFARERAISALHAGLEAMRRDASSSQWRGVVSLLLHQAAHRGVPVSREFASLMKNCDRVRREVAHSYGPEYAAIIPTRAIPVGPDLRTRSRIRPFGSVTGRAQIYGASLLLANKVLRGFVRPPTGRVFVVADVDAEEHGLAAALAGDDHAWNAYASGDYYSQTALEAGLSRAGSSDADRSARRSSVKLALNQLLNGASVQTAVARSGLGVVDVLALRRCLQERRARTLAWIDARLANARREGRLVTSRGWQVSAARDVRDATLRSVLLQGAGVDLMGEVLVRADRMGIQLCGTLHDAFMFETDQDAADGMTDAFRNAFEDACVALLGTRYRLGLSFRTVSTSTPWLSRRTEERFRRIELFSRTRGGEL